MIVPFPVMKLLSFTLLAAALLAVPCAGSAADAKSKKKTPTKVAPTVTVKDLAIGEARKCDTNHNGRIDSAEMMDVRQAWKTNPNSYLYLFDDNSNKYLDDSELSKIDLGANSNKPTPAGKKSNKKKKK